MAKRRITISATLDDEKYCNGCPCDQNDEGMLYCSAQAGERFLDVTLLANDHGGWNVWRIRPKFCPAKLKTKKK